MEDDSLQKVHIFLLFVFSILATIAVGLRIWSRKLQQQKLMVYDHLMVLGLMLALAETGVNIYGCCYPDQWRDNTQANDIKLSLQLAFLSTILWGLAVTTIRASIIFLYIHLFPPRLFRIICFSALALNLLFLTSIILADCLICQPISSTWDFTIKSSCGDQHTLDLYIAILNLFQDITVIVLPMPILWRLRMATKKKIALSGIFSIGIGICAVTIYRIQVTASIKHPRGPHTQGAYSLIALLTSLETLLGIISACLPMMRPVAMKCYGLFPKRGVDSTLTSTLGKIPMMARLDLVPKVSYTKHPSSKDASSMDSLWVEEG